jgi:hypothetical protein
MNGMPFDAAVRQGLAAAAATVETQTAVADFADKARFRQLLAKPEMPEPDK